MNVKGIHHLTAMTGSAEDNYKFYTDVLGMRLVKKTVNQDDTTAYHLFYGDEKGTPGTEPTFFDFPGVRQTIPDPNSISNTSMRVATDEPIETLGESLSLPPFLENQRESIAANIKPLQTKR